MHLSLFRSIVLYCQLFLFDETQVSPSKPRFYSHELKPLAALLLASFVLIYFQLTTNCNFFGPPFPLCFNQFVQCQPRLSVAQALAKAMQCWAWKQLWSDLGIFWYPMSSVIWTQQILCSFKTYVLIIITQWLIYNEIFVQTYEREANTTSLDVLLSGL